MAPRGKRLLESSDRSAARQRPPYDTGLFGSPAEYKKYDEHFRLRRVVAGRDIDFAALRKYRLCELFEEMRWLPLVSLREPIYPTLMRVFFARARQDGFSLTSTIRGQEIILDPDSICRTLEIPAVGLPVYEVKVPMNIHGYDHATALRRLCRPGAPVLGKACSSSLTTQARLLHMILIYCVIPHGGHRDEVSYFHTFVMDSILTGRRLHLSHIMMHHMIQCFKTPHRVIPFGRFFTRFFMSIGIELSQETDVEPPRRYDTFDSSTLRRMMKRPRNKDHQPEEEDEIGDMEGGDRMDEDLAIPPIGRESTFRASPPPEPRPPQHEQHFTFPKPHYPPSMDEPSCQQLQSDILDVGEAVRSLADMQLQFSESIDRRFISFETRSDEFETRIRQDLRAITARQTEVEQRFTEFEEERRREHRHLMDFLHSRFPPLS